jgi:hypothetical protein
MPPVRLILCPTESAYSTERSADGYLRTSLDGGMGRYRKDILGSSTLVNCRWVVTGIMFDYLWAFYRDYLRKIEPFHIELVLEEGARVRVLANVVPNSFKFGEKKGGTHTVTAQLEVLAPEYDAQADEDMIWLIGEFGEDYELWVERLWKIVNIDYPVAMPIPPLYQ